MDKNESIEHVLDNMDPRIAYKKKSSIAMSSLLVALSIVSFVTYTSFQWQASDTLPHLLFILGFTFLILGILFFFFRKSHYVSLESNQPLKVSERYFDVKEQGKLVSLIESGSLNEIINLKLSVSAGLRIRVLATRDGQVCLSQVIAYISNESVNITSPKLHSLAEAEQFKSIFQK